MATVRSVVKTLIEYNSNNLEENDEEKKELILNLLRKILIMMKMLLTLNDQINKMKRKILVWLTSLKLQKQADEEIFFKVTGWLFDDCGIIPNEKKN